MSIKEKVFVFGSNLAGRHGAGAAKAAYEDYGATYGIGQDIMGPGRLGRCYAIPTKDHRIKTLPLDQIKVGVDAFLAYAAKTPEFDFHVTRVGCGLAGYKDSDIAPLFKQHPGNCFFDIAWLPYLECAEHDDLH